MDVYADNILEHFKHPHNAKLLKDADSTHEEENTSCGDRIMITLQTKDNVITDIGWKGEGCAISLAGMSILSEELSEKTLDEVLQMKKEDIFELLGVPIGERRIKCALMCLHTLKNCIHKMQKNEMQSWVETVQ